MSAVLLIGGFATMIGAGQAGDGAGIFVGLILVVVAGIVGVGETL